MRCTAGSNARPWSFRCWIWQATSAGRRRCSRQLRERGTLPRQGRAGQVCIDTATRNGLFAHGEINFGKRGDGIGAHPRAAAASCSAFACSAAAIRASSSARAASSAAMRAASSSASIASMPCEMSRDAVLVSTVDSRVEPSDTLAKSAEIGNGDIRVRTADAERIDIVHGAASSRGEPEADAPGQHARCAADRDNFSSQVRLLLYIALFSQNVSYLFR